MNDLIAQVAEKAGVTPDQARTAVDAVLRFLKDKLPAPAAGQLDALLADADGGRSMGDAIKHLRANLGGS
jgi:uncharacterized protein (DUF2267 family)